MHVKACPNMGYIFVYNSIQFSSTKSVHHKNCALHIICIQNSYKIYANNCKQGVCHISIYCDTFVVYFLGNHCTQLKIET